MLEKIKEMAPLFQPHAFWDTQPVQKGMENFAPTVRIKNLPFTII